MVNRSALWISIGLLVLGGSRGAGAEEAPRLSLRLAKGETMRFAVEREIRSKAGESQQVWSTAAEYDIRLVEEREGGERIVELSYASARARDESERGSWEFDSRKEADGDEVDALIRKAIGSPIRVVISKGQVREISGFPRDEMTRGDRESRFRRWRASQVAGHWNVRRDLFHIFPAHLWEKPLVKGKSLPVTGGEEIGEPDRPRRPPPGMGPRLEYRLESIEEAEGERQLEAKGQGKDAAGAVAVFSLSLSRRESHRGEAESRERPRREESSDGRAAISLRDGLVRELSFETKSEASGRFRDRDFRFVQTTKLRIERREPEPAKKDGTP